jgi:hypothetical protein
MENTMAQRLKNLESVKKVAFPPEADGEFDTVPTVKIAEWREKLNARFGIGKGRLTVISEPSAET